MHVVAEAVTRILIQTLMLLKPLNKMRFDMLDILSGRQSLFYSQYISHKSSSVSNDLGHGKSSLKLLANKLDFSFQFTFS